VTEAEFRDFIREQTLRHERASRSTERWLRIADKRTDEMARRSDEMVKRSDELIAEIRELRADFRAESQAQRAALFAILDKLNGGAPPATA
jgi:hypothetical protein